MPVYCRRDGGSVGQAMNSGTPWTTVYEQHADRAAEDPTLSYKAVATAMPTKFGLSITKNACIGQSTTIGG